MNNDFFAFIETYKDDIIAFFDSLKALIETIIGKLTASDEEAEEA